MSNYNERNPTLSFRVERKEKNLLDRMSEKKKMNVNELAKDILTKYIKGELILAKDDQQKELMKLRIEKIKSEIKYMQIKNNYFETFNAPMSRSATVHIKPQVIVETSTPSQQVQQSPYDAKNRRIQCVECGVLFFWKHTSEEMRWVIKEYKKHLLVKHGRNMTIFESDVIDNLEFEGASL